MTQTVDSAAGAPRGRRRGDSGGGYFSLSRLMYSARDEQMRMLSQSARLEEAGTPRLVVLTALSISLSVICFLGWAGVTNINEVARTPGEVVPAGFEQTVQHLDGGVIGAILAREGAVVEKGQLLIVLDGGGAHEDLRRAERKHWALEVRAERLRAIVQERDPDLTQFALDTTLVAEQREIFETMVAARMQQANIIRDQITQKQQDLAILTLRRETADKNLEGMLDIERIYSELHDKGHLSYVKLAEIRQQLNLMEGESGALAQQIQQARGAIDEFETRLLSLGAIQKDEAYRQLFDLEAELAQNQQVIAKLKRKVERLAVAAPVRGIVKGLAVNTIGGVVAPGQTLMSIVPLDEKLVIETRIPPQHIGHLQVGQPVQIKFSAYDYARYGAVTGRLESISATTFHDDGKGRHYRGRVAFDQEHIGSNPARNPVLPGMTVMAEIITGEKTVLQYLLKPVRQAFEASFSER